MNKFLLLLFISPFFIHESYAQITITENDLPVVGDHWVVFGNDGFVDMTIGSASAQTWNYTADYNPADTFDYTYATAAAAPPHTYFPGADFSIFIGIGYQFFTSTDEGFYINGGWFLPDFFPDDSLDIYEIPALVMPVPFTKGSSKEHTSKVVYTVYEDGGTYFKDVEWESVYFTVDAFGTITTPFRNNTPTIRVVAEREYADTTFSSSSPTGPFTDVESSSSSSDLNNYFVGNTKPYLIMEIQTDGADQTDVFYYSNTLGTGIKETGKSVVFSNVYPNPAAASAIHFNIKGQGAKWLKVYNLIGQCVQTEIVSGVNTLLLKGNNLQTGAYLYQVTDNDGNMLDEKKFVVQ